MVGLVVAACGSPAVPVRSGGPKASLDAGQVGSTLPVGLSANLDKLDSYQFTQSIPRPSTAPSTAPSTTPSTRPSTRPSTTPSTRPSTSPSPTPSTRPSTRPSTTPSTRPSTRPSTTPSTSPSVALSAASPPGPPPAPPPPRSAASPSTARSAGSPSVPAPTNRDPLTISGTVVNRPVKALSINTHPSQFIVVGDQAWQSTNGITWTRGDPTDTILTDLLPGHDYPTWFDAKATYFHAVGDETKNGVACIHYQGDKSLQGLYAGVAGTSVPFVADLWIAKDGEYPVSGTFGFAGAAGG